MSEVKHTPTPWDFEESEYSVIITRGGFSIGVMFNSKVSGEWLPALPNAAHIVKCVNMHDELVDVLSGLMKVYNEPDETICCNGYECGCQGASVRQQAEYYARETLKKAGAL